MRSIANANDLKKSRVLSYTLHPTPYTLYFDGAQSRVTNTHNRSILRLLASASDLVRSSAAAHDPALNAARNTFYYTAFEQETQTETLEIGD